MNRISRIIPVLASIVMLAACGRGEVVVHAVLEGQTAGEGAAEGQPLRNLAIRLVPYDRDAVFDSLQAAYPQPEPAIPDSLLLLQDEIASARERWENAEQGWNAGRERQRNLFEELETMSRASAQYRVMFAEYNDLESEVIGLEREKDAAFSEFEELQLRLRSESAELRMAIEQWEDEAFADIDVVIGQRLEESGREELREVTDATGTARFVVQPGRWWVTARFELPYRDLYWNVPIEVMKGEPVSLQLTQENATARPRLGG